MDTTEDLSVRFDAVTDDTAVAMGTHRRQRVDCALETVKSVTFSAHDHFKRLVIIVLANFACRHTQSVRAKGGSWRCLFSVASDCARGIFLVFTEAVSLLGLAVTLILGHSSD